MLAATLPMMISCNEDDISSDITEIIYPSYVNVDIPDELQGYIYTDATQADVLPMLKGEKATLGYTMPDDANYRDVVWESSNPDVATVDENGLVTAVGGDGTSYSIITVHPKVYFSGSNGLAGTLKILVSDVLNPVTDVRISFDERDEYYESDILLLKYALSPVDATYRTVKWTSSDSETATVDSNGKVILLKAGTVTITATSMDGKASDSVTFNILTGEAPTSVTFDDENAFKNLAYGQKLDLKALVKMEPADATFSKISWSDGAGLCSIDGNGIMTVKYTGMPTILAMSGHNTELVASDRNTGAELGRITITVDGGYFRYNFGDGVNDAFVLKEGTTYTKQDRSIYFDLNQSGRQDISIASTNNQGGFYISTAKYRYFAMKMRRPYNYDEGTGAYGSCAPGTPAPGSAAHLPFYDAVWDRLRIAFVQAACGFEPTDSICAALRLRYPCIPCGRNAVHVRRIRTAGKRKALFSRLRAWRTGPQHRRAFGSVCPDAVSAPAALRCGSGNAVSGRAGETYMS